MRRWTPSIRWKCDNGIRPEREGMALPPLSRFLDAERTFVEGARRQMKFETFSYLPPMTQEQVTKQVQYILDNGFVPIIEYTSKLDINNDYWGLWKLPLFDAKTTDEVLAEGEACKAANPGCYIKLNGYDVMKQQQRLSFVIYRPEGR
jgi:ribulose-bisphosphate carboxylase small chain